MLEEKEDKYLPEGVEIKVTNKKKKGRNIKMIEEIDGRLKSRFPILKGLYGDNCFKSLIREIEEHSGLRDLKIEKEAASCMIGLGGTGVCKEGYSLLVDLIEESKTVLTEKEKTVQKTSVLVKYSGKHADFQNAERGGRLTSFLYKSGYEFVPFVFLPNLKLINDSFFYSGLNLPIVFEFLPGYPLEERINRSIFPIKETTSQKFHLTSEFSSIVQDIFSSMFRIYSDPRLRKGSIEHLLGRYTLVSGGQPDIINPITSQRFHKSLLNRFSFDNTGFIKRFNQSYVNELDELSICLVHNDLHPGNVLLLEENLKILDWDNASLGIPYQDFFHFSLISGFERNADFDTAKIEIKKMYESLERAPILSEKHYALLEFDVCLSLLDRYYRSAVDGNFGSTMEGCNDVSIKVLETCNYLLLRSKECLNKYEELANNKSISDYYNKFINLNYSHLDSYIVDKSIFSIIMLKRKSKMPGSSGPFKIHFDSRRDIKSFEVPFAHAVYHLFDRRINARRETDNIVQHIDNLQPFL